MASRQFARFSHPVPFARLAFFLSAALGALLAGCVSFGPPEPRPDGPIRLTRVAFGDLGGWAANDPRISLAVLARSCAVRMSGTAPDNGSDYAGTNEDWRPVCRDAEAMSYAGADQARAFIEATLVPYRVSQGADEANEANQEGLFTGYFEPELNGSRTRHGPYQTPLHGVPADLVSVDLGLFRESLRGQRLAGRIEGGRLVPYAARGEIVQNGLPQAKELLYVDDPVDAFFLQIQGSGRVVLDDGTVMRAVYAGQNGRPYTPIGAILIDQGELMREEVSMQSIRAWLAANPARARALMDQNASYIFFALEPLGDPNLGARGSQGVPLTPGVSMAVDAAIHPLGVPLWLEAPVPHSDPAKPDYFLTRLMVAQDTGGAIRGAVRGDVYWGFGDAAGAIAGRMRSIGRMTVLVPQSVAARLGASVEFPGAGS